MQVHTMCTVTDKRKVILFSNWVVMTFSNDVPTKYHYHTAKVCIQTGEPEFYSKFIWLS